MRIRTIKPAFWANEKMAALPDFARLLAIGLLNYADDHGFFWANSLMIRGSLFPFEEDSSKVRRGLAQLEAEGYVRLGKTSDGREVGHVVKFSKHQRVDKPQPSEIEPLAIFVDRSENTQISLDDDSALYGKGKEGKGKEGNAVGDDSKTTVIPLLLSTDDFGLAWAAWLKHRKEKREPVRPGSQAEKMQLKKLEDWGPQRACAAIYHSIASDYQGIFEPTDRQRQEASGVIGKRSSMAG